MTIEFTDRYGGNVPSLLRVCRGHCEGTGYYPVQGHEPDHRRSSDCCAVTPRPLSAVEMREITRRIEAGEREADGWYFLTCGDCQGSGRCAYPETLRRIPRWLLRGARFCWQHGPQSMAWHGHPATWTRRAWLTFKVAFLCDLGARV